MSFYVWKENSESMQREWLGGKLKLKPLGAWGKALNYVTKINLKQENKRSCCKGGALKNLKWNSKRIFMACVGFASTRFLRLISDFYDSRCLFKHAENKFLCE